VRGAPIELESLIYKMTVVKLLKYVWGFDDWNKSLNWGAIKYWNVICVQSQFLLIFVNVQNGSSHYIHITIHNFALL
jgi:hypothetical protein